MLKELLTEEHKLYHLAFAESSIDCKWDRVIFSDESTFNSANGGPVLFTDLGESSTTLSICLPAPTVVVCLFSDGAGSRMKGLECSIV